VHLLAFGHCFILIQVLQEKDAMVMRAADEVVAVKLQAKAAAAKFTERASSETSALQAEIKQLQVKQQNLSFTSIVWF
jgi:hypothetical protein